MSCHMDSTSLNQYRHKKNNNNSKVYFYLPVSSIFEGLENREYNYNKMIMFTFLTLKLVSHTPKPLMKRTRPVAGKHTSVLHLKNCTL